MASIKKRPNGTWRARYRDASGHEHAKHFARKVDAQRWLDEVTTSVVTGVYVDPKAGRQTVRVYGERWRVDRLSAGKPDPPPGSSSGGSHPHQVRDRHGLVARGDLGDPCRLLVRAMCPPLAAPAFTLHVLPWLKPRYPSLRSLWSQWRLDLPCLSFAHFHMGFPHRAHGDHSGSCANAAARVFLCWYP